MITFLNRLNKGLEKIMPLITPTSLVIGVALAEWLRPYSSYVPWIFAVMTLIGSLGSNFKDMARVLMHPLPLLFCMLLLHVVLPLVGLAGGSLVFPGDHYTITGIVLAFAIPTGIISLMWVTLYKGNIALTLSIILIDTFLSPFIVPLTLRLLVGAEVKIDMLGMMSGLLFMVVIPSVIGMVLNQWTKGQIKKKLGPPLAPFQKIGLIFVVAINSSVVAPYLKQWDAKLFVIVATVVVIAISSYAIGWLVAKLMGWDSSVIVAMTFNSGMRNISAGTVLAITYFPPPVAMPVIMTMLFQQLLASCYAQLLNARYNKGRSASSPAGDNGAITAAK